jgi:superfamily II DNA or RNA helicase
MLETNQCITLCSVTGSGKSLVMSSLIELLQRYQGKVNLFTNRRLLTQQTAKNLSAHGIDFGVRAASMPNMRDLYKPIQISSMQTEIARCIETQQWSLHDSDLALIDEAHMMGSGRSLDLIQRLLGQGTKVVLVTATPIGLNHITPNLFVASTNSEMRQCGALVKAIVKSASELDCSRVRRVKEKYDPQSVRECWRQAIIGHVLSDYLRFNPQRRLSLGFAPGVPESRALAHYFNANGVRAAHIDAKEVWVNGVYTRDNIKGDARRQVIEDWRAGKIDVIWNCEVFREAIDVPELYHLMLATPICSLKDFVQICGRVLRYSPATPDHVIVQDHCGNCITRHGSPNQDYDWHELYNMSEVEICEMQERKREEQKPEEVPAACPKCGTVVKYGSCPPPPVGCGEPINKNNPRKMRFVVQENGQLRTVPESMMRPKKRKVSTESIEQKRWNDIYFASRRSKSNRAMTFGQAAAVYEQTHGVKPVGLKFMPVDPLDWGRKIRDVSPKDLTQGA